MADIPGDFPYPTIGRIVHYTDCNGETFPAIIVKVHSADCIDIEIFGPCKERYLTVVYRQSNGSFGGWDWPQRV